MVYCLHMRYTPYNFFLLPVIFYLFGSFAFVYAGSEKKIPRAERGVLDLGQWSLDEHGIANLEGEWEFYWKAFIDPAEQGEKNPEYIRVPGRWNDFKENGKPIGGDGYATYRLTVLLDRAEELIAIKTYEISTAYALFVNGTKVMSLGTVGMEEAATNPRMAPRLKLVPVRGNTIEIVLHVSNFVEMNGGIWYHAPVIGTEERMVEKQELSRLLQVFLLGCIVIIAFYHLCMFFFRKEDTPSLFFSAFCLSICLRLLITGESYLIEYFCSLPGDCIARLQNASFFIAAPLFSVFTYSLFKAGFSRFISRCYIGISALFVLFTVLTSLKFLSHVLNLYGIMTLTYAVYLLYVIFRAIAGQRKETVIFLAGFIVLIAAVFNDQLYHNQIVNTMFMTPWGLFVFIIAQSFMISLMFSKTFEKVKKYSLELEDYSRNLEKKVAERTKQLEDATERKTRLFVNLAHDTKTPLTLIGNCLKRLIRRTGLSDELKIVKENFDRLISDMSDYIDIERLDRGQIVYDHSRVMNLSDAIRTKVFLFGETAMSLNLELSSEIRDGIYSKMDSYAFERIADNIIDNALRYTNPGGSVRVSLDKRKDKAVLVVEDTGIGMSREQCRHIFEPFYRATRGKEGARGAGIGLSIVKSIIESVKGEIRFESVPGEGTRVTIVLDRHEDPGADAVAAPVNAPLSAPRSGGIAISDSANDINMLNVFIIEDDREMAAYLVDSMKGKYNVYYATGGQHALQKIALIPRPSIIISDIAMPGMSGHELYDALMKDDEYADIPFVFLTAKTSKKDRLAGLKQGAIEYIAKPFDIDELLARIDSIIGYTRTIRKMNTKKTAEKLLKSIRREIKGDSAINVEDNCRKYNISAREKQIVRLLFQGKMYKEICSELKVSYNTARNHISHIYDKCNVKSRAELFNVLRKPPRGIGPGKRIDSAARLN